MNRFLNIFLFLSAGCYQPQRLPSPLPTSLAQRLDLGFAWIATTLDTTEGRGDHRIRLLASQGPTPAGHFQKPFVHDSAWLEAHAHVLGVSGVCKPPFNECFPQGGYLLVVGLPDPSDGHASYVWTQFSLYAPGQKCEAPPGAGGSSRTTPPWWVSTLFWNLYMVRDGSGGWAIDSTNAKGSADAFADPCAHAA